MTDYQKKVRNQEVIMKFACLIMGILADVFYFYLSIFVDCYLDTFSDAVTHVIVFPIFVSIIIIYLECKYVSESVKPDALFIVGSILGIFAVLDRTLTIPNYNLFLVDDYIAYNLVRYFTPTLVFIMSNIIVYLIRRVFYLAEVQLAENMEEITKAIEKTNEEYELRKDEVEKEEKKDFFDKSHEIIKKISDSLAKRIDPDFKDDEDN